MKIALSFAIVFICVHASAGVRVVSGGGYAEMQATLINSEFSTWTRVCFLKSNPCGLNEEESKMLSTSLQKTLKLRFVPHCSGSPVAIDNFGQVTIQSCALYKNQQAFAKDFGDIAGLVLLGRLLGTTDLNFSGASALAKKVFIDFNQTEQQLTVILSESSTVFHALKILRGSERFNLVSIEGLKETVDISSILKEALSCQDSEVIDWDLDVLAFQELTAKKALVETQVSWKCQDQSTFSAKAELSYSTLMSEIIFNSINVQIVQKVAF